MPIDRAFAARLAALAEKHTYGVIAQMFGLTPGKVSGLIFRYRHGSNSRIRIGRSGKGSHPYRHKTHRYKGRTEWLPPAKSP